MAAYRTGRRLVGRFYERYVRHVAVSQSNRTTLVMIQLLALPGPLLVGSQKLLECRGEMRDSSFTVSERLCP